MWALAVSNYAACRWLTRQAAPAGSAPGWKHTAYLLAWPGLDAAGFLEERASLRCCAAELCAAAGSLTLGVALLFGVARIVPSEDPYLAG